MNFVSHSPSRSKDSGLPSVSVAAIRASLLGLLMLVILSVPPALSATTWTVTSTGDDPNDTTTLRGALTAATDGDAIDLTGLTGTITLTYGGAPVQRELPVVPNLTIKGPGASKLAIDGGNFSSVFHIYSGISVTISGLTIQNGSANTSDYYAGGGIRNSGTLTLADSTLSSNAAILGGGIYNSPIGNLTVSNCTISGNSASQGGGILSDSGGTVSVSNSTITGNTAGSNTDFGSGAGAGIYIGTNGTLTVTSSTISGNTAGTNTAGGQGYGAGIYIDTNGTLTVTGSAISDNVAKGDKTSGGFGGYGGGISSDATAAVSNTSISGNIAQDGAKIPGQGGGITAGGTLTVTASTLSANTPEGILVNGTASITNSTLSGHSFAPAVDGFGTANLINSTLSGNFIGVDSAGSFTLKNTILASNNTNCYTEIGGTITSQDHNISDDSSCANDLNQPHDFAPGTSPGLDSAGLKDNGGPTKTIALMPGSVAVDAINPSSDCSVSTDQRGTSRPQGNYCDIGAYEATPDFYFSSIPTINANVGSSGTANVQVNSFVGFNSAVALTSSGVPADFTTSFNPTSVTPPSYGSVSSMLTVNIGPSVTAGTYGFNVVGTSGTLTHSAHVSVIVAVTTGSVGQVIGTDLALGCIANQGISNSLTSKLTAAQNYINAGDIQDAINTLTALLNELQAQAGKRISTTCTDSNGDTFNAAQVLIADVEALLASLGAAPADPILGNVVNGSGTGVSGVTVKILSSAKNIVATATTDVTGFYYFAATGGLTPGASYSVKVSVPKGYKSSTPASYSVTWKALEVILNNFVLN